jgi:hypothetical protein
MALNFYLEGLGIRAIGRLLKVSHVAVLKWIRSFGEAVTSLRNQQAAQIVEMDELHTYIGQKKEVPGFGLLLTEKGENPSILLWVTEPKLREKSSGKKLKNIPSAPL